MAVPDEPDVHDCIFQIVYTFVWVLQSPNKTLHGLEIFRQVNLKKNISQDVYELVCAMKYVKWFF